MTIVHRTLLLGLGPSGRLILQGLKQLFERECDCAPFVRMLVIDYEKGDSAGDLKLYEAFTPAEVVPLSEHGVADYLKQEVEARDTLPIGVDPAELAQIPESLIMTRLGAKLMFMQKRQEIIRTLAHSVRRFFDNAEDAWQRATQKGFQAAQGQELRIFLVASAADAVGSGLILEAVGALQELAGSEHYDISQQAVLMLFGDPQESENSLANIYAALKELHYHTNNNRDTSINPIYIIELTNERGIPFGAVSEGRAIVTQWLYRAILNPTLTEPSQRNGLLYSSFGYARCFVPQSQIHEYWTVRLAADLTGDHCILSESFEDTSEELAGLFWQKQQLEPDILIGLNREGLLETPLSLSIADQTAATVLFTNMSGSNTEVDALVQTPLSQMRQKMETETSLWEKSYYPQYQRKVQENVKLVFNARMAEEITIYTQRMTTERPVGALELGERFLRSTRERIAKSVEAVKQSQQRAQLELDEFTSRCKAAKEAALQSLENFPTLFRTVGRFGFALLGGVLIIAGFALALTHSNSMDMAAAFERYLLLPSLGGTLAIFMAFVCSIKFVFDHVIGEERLRRGEDNIPGLAAVIFAVVYAVVVGTVLTWAFLNLSGNLVLPPSVPNAGTPAVDLAAYKALVVLNIVFLTLWSILSYVFWYWYDWHKMRRLTYEWRRQAEKLATQTALIERISAGLHFYEVFNEKVDDLLQHNRSIKEKLKRLKEDWDVEVKRCRDEFSKGPRFQRAVTSLDSVDNVYEEYIKDIGAEAVEIFKTAFKSLRDLGDAEQSTIQSRIAAYVDHRFSDYWEAHDVYSYLVRTSEPKRYQLEKSLGWLVTDVSKPFWSYHAQARGALSVHIGLSSHANNQLFIDTFKGLAGPLGAEPVFLEIEDKHQIVCITCRDGVPLHYLASLPKAREVYRKQIKGWPWLHTNRQLAEEIKDLDLFPTGYPILQEEDAEHSVKKQSRKQIKESHA